MAPHIDATVLRSVLLAQILAGGTDAQVGVSVVKGSNVAGDTHARIHSGNGIGSGFHGTSKNDDNAVRVKAQRLAPDTARPGRSDRAGGKKYGSANNKFLHTANERSVHGQRHANALTEPQSIRQLSSPSSPTSPTSPSGSSDKVPKFVKSISSTKSPKSIKSTKSPSETKSPKSSKSSKQGSTAPVPTSAPSSAPTERCGKTAFAEAFDCTGTAATVSDCNRLIESLQTNGGLLDFFACQNNGAAVLATFVDDPGLLAALDSAASTTEFFTGTSDEVTAACAADASATCCPNPGDCTWQGYSTIATSACSGTTACNQTASNVLILANSCTGMLSCQYINYGTTGITFVGENACTGEDGCYAVGVYTTGDVIIETNSCTGEDACDSVGARAAGGGSDATVRIGADACQMEDSCFAVHAYTMSKTDGDVTIGDRACQGEDACNSIGYADSFVADLELVADVCRGSDVCRDCAVGSFCSVGQTLVIDEVSDCPTPNTATECVR